MTPSTFKLVPYIPRFDLAVLSATGHEFSRENEVCQTGSLAPFSRLLYRLDK